MSEKATCPSCNEEYGFFTLLSFLIYTGKSISYLEYECPTPSCFQRVRVDLKCKLLSLALPMVFTVIIGVILSTLVSDKSNYVLIYAVFLVMVLLGLVLSLIISAKILPKCLSFKPMDNQQVNN